MYDATWSQCFSFFYYYGSHIRVFFWSYWDLNLYDLILVLLIYIYFQTPSGIESPLWDNKKKTGALFCLVDRQRGFPIFFVAIERDCFMSVCVCECMLKLSPNLTFFHQFCSFLLTNVVVFLGAVDKFRKFSQFLFLRKILCCKN